MRKNLCVAYHKGKYVTFGDSVRGKKNMNCTDLISIVLPVYNGERFLSQSIDSILRQTYRNWELIIVNDCSSDNTLKICQEYISRDTRIRIVNNVINQKLPRSLNIGFQNAKGSYLTWTSDDNCYEENALERLIDFLHQNTEYGMVYSDMILIDENGLNIGQRMSKENQLYSINCIGASFLYTRECYEKTGEYDINRFLVEDYEYWLRIAKSFRIGHLSEFLYKYRFHNNSLTFLRMKQIGKRLLELKIDYLDDIINHSSQEELKALLFELTTYGLEINHIICNKILSFIDDLESVKWILRRNKEMNLSKVWLFGAGAFGSAALQYIGKEKVLGFIDNNKSKTGTTFCSRSIISLSNYINEDKHDAIVISTDVRNAYYISEQLEQNNIDNYLVLYDIIEGINEGTCNFWHTS